MGQGRWGVRVANSPVLLPARRGGRTLASNKESRRDVQGRWIPFLWSNDEVLIHWYSCGRRREPKYDCIGWDHQRQEEGPTPQYQYEIEHLELDLVVSEHLDNVHNRIEQTQLGWKHIHSHLLPFSVLQSLYEVPICYQSQDIITFSARTRPTRSENRKDSAVFLFDTSLFIWNVRNRK